MRDDKSNTLLVIELSTFKPRKEVLSNMEEEHTSRVWAEVERQSELFNSFLDLEEKGEMEAFEEFWIKQAC